MDDDDEVLVRGSLRIVIQQAKDLPNRDTYALRLVDVASWFSGTKEPSRNTSGS